MYYEKLFHKIKFFSLNESISKKSTESKNRSPIDIKYYFAIFVYDFYNFSKSKNA